MEPRMNGSSLGPEPVYLPWNEPYRGRASLVSFDDAIRACMLANFEVAARTTQIPLTDLQYAACQVIPQGINLTLAIRALIRQGYLFGALVLVRPLLERVTTMAYLYQHPESLEIWKAGWKRGKRPSFHQMLNCLNPLADSLVMRQMGERLHHIVHGDPDGSLWNLVVKPDGGMAFAAGQVTNHPELCDNICSKTEYYLTLLHGLMAICFPDVPRADDIFDAYRRRHGSDDLPRDARTS